MSIAIVTFVVFIAGLIRFQWAVMIYIFCLPFFPRSVALAVNDGLALTQKRAGIITIFILFLIYFYQKRAFRIRLYSLFKKQGTFFCILLLLLLLKFYSTFIHSDTQSLLYAVDELLSSLFIVCIVYISIKTVHDEKKFMLILISGLFLSGIMSGLEQLKGAPLLQGIVEVDVKTANDIVLSGKERDGNYRSQALFDNPLLLSEFASFILPFLLFGIVKFRSWARIITFGTIILLPYILWGVYARSGFIVTSIGLFAFLFILIWKKSDLGSRSVLVSIIVTVCTLLILLSISIISNPDSYFSESTSGGKSALERISQLGIISTVFENSPFTGFGMSQNLLSDTEQLRAIDNYWLRLMFESGLIGLILFILLVAIMLKKTNFYLHRSLIKIESIYFSAILSYFIVFISYKLFISIPTNNIYFFVVCAMLFWHIDHYYHSPLQNKYLYAHSSHS